MMFGYAQKRRNLQTPNIMIPLPFHSKSGPADMLATTSKV